MNVALWLARAGLGHPTLPAAASGTRVVASYGQLAGRAARLAGALREKFRLKPGDRVAIAAKNSHHYLELLFGIWHAGCAAVPANAKLHGAELGFILEHSGARVCFASPGIDSDIAPHAPKYLERLIVIGGADYEALFAADAVAVEPRAGGDLAWLFYTSGTTGRPKGVPRTHAADRAGGLGQALQHGYEHGDRTLGVMPLYHTMGIHSLLAMHLIGGCYVPQARWNPREALRLIEEERITSLYLAPTLFHDLVGEQQLAERDLSSVRALGYAGAAMTSTVVTRCVEVFEPEVFVNHYGSTEIYTFSIGRDQAGKPGCAGRPSVNTRLKLEQSGEICAHLSSDEAFGGYWNRPDADAKGIRDGWYHTGDTGHLDADGDLWVDGRLDDMIISGGENIHPVEVEDILASHPGVDEVAVVGAPDDRLGHRVVAVVVGDATAEELDAHCLASALARFKRPREYRLVSALPKSASGKILRRVLRNDSGEAIPAETGIALDGATLPSAERERFPMKTPNSRPTP
jgi:2-furoate---CoA ligase